MTAKILQDIILTIDTREQNQRRIKAVEDWVGFHGAIIEHSALKLCDYRLIGEFRGVPVNLGIEAKSMNDFISSYIDLPDKLSRAYKLYKDVALFIESGNYTFKPDEDNFNAFVENTASPIFKDGKRVDINTLLLSVYENIISSLEYDGIHVRQLRSELHFPYAIAGLLINITKPIHTGLNIDVYDTDSQDEKFLKDYYNMLGKIKGIGYKRASIIVERYPNMAWLCSASEESLKRILGNILGKKVYDVMHYHGFETETWRNNFHRDGIEKDEPEKYICSACGLDKCTCIPNSNNPLLKEDDKGKLRLMPQARTGEPIMVGLPFDVNKTSKKCDFADPKNRAACKTPDHFKHPSHEDKGFSSVPHSNPCPLSSDNSHEGDNKNAVIIPQTHSHTPSDKNTSHESTGKNSDIPISLPLLSDTLQSPTGILSYDSSSLPVDDTSQSSKDDTDGENHAGRNKVTPTSPSVSQLSGSFFEETKPGDTQGTSPKPSLPPIRCPASKSFCSLPCIPSSGDEKFYDGELEYLNENKPEFKEVPPLKLSMVIKIPEECESKSKMTLKTSLIDYWNEHDTFTLQDCVDAHSNWSPGNVFDHVMGAVKSEYLKKYIDHGIILFAKKNQSG